MTRVIQGWANDNVVSDHDLTGEASGLIIDTRSTRLVDFIAHGLAEIGVETAFGIIGGAVAPMGDAIAQSPLRLVHCRHEAGAAFAATEASLASGRPCAVFCTTGPGFTNALTGLFAGRLEGASIILISAATPASLRGRGAFQETGPHNMPAGLYNPGGLFHLAATIEDAAQMDEVMVRLRRGLLRPGGFLAHLSVPTQNQTRPVAQMPAPTSARSYVSSGTEAVAAVDVDRCVEALLSLRTALWVGFGARGASNALLKLAERLQLPVMCTPRGKGVFPEQHPLYVGVTGFAGHDSVHKMLEDHDPESIIVLGSRLGEFSSMWDEHFVRPHGFIHVDLDLDAIGVAYPRAMTYGIRADIDAFVRAVLAKLPASIPVRAAPRFRGHCPPSHQIPRRRGLVRPLALMEAIQRVMVDDSEALLISEAGNSFAWGNHSLYFPRPGRYRVSTSWGSMGHAVSGVLGAGLCHGEKAVAIAGDGAMLMNNELSTAVQYGVPAVWIILNDSQYGLIEHGMRSLGYVPEGTEIPRVDFVAIARAVGADGVRVSIEQELDAALEQAMAAPGPFVVDVLIDPGEAPPVGSRVERLREQGVDGAWSEQEEG
jgi:acetolactate synthase-1/2/3 large subunit